jgi:hypothetical protein
MQVVFKVFIKMVGKEETERITKYLTAPSLPSELLANKKNVGEIALSKH